MGFLFGLFIGAAVTGGGGSTVPSLGTIPFRCLAAFESSEIEYRMCRSNTLRREVYDGSPCTRADMDKPDGQCSLEQNMAWEIAGLRQLKSGIEKNATK